MKDLSFDQLPLQVDRISKKLDHLKELLELEKKGADPQSSEILSIDEAAQFNRNLAAHFFNAFFHDIAAMMVIDETRSQDFTQQRVALQTTQILDVT